MNGKNIQKLGDYLIKSILPFTQDHEDFRKILSKFAENEIVPYYKEWHKNHEIPRSLYKRMGDQGWLCTWADKKYGGLGLDVLYQIIMIQETTGSVDFFIRF